METSITFNAPESSGSLGAAGVTLTSTVTNWDPNTLIQYFHSTGITFNTTGITFDISKQATPERKGFLDLITLTK